MITTTRDDDVFVLNLGDGDNRFNPETIAAINETLTAVEIAAEGGNTALVTTATGKIYHNGLDLDHMGGLDSPAEFLSSVHHLFARMMRLPCPTIAAMQGHSFAGGALFSLSHDLRYMREDRGFFCLPEVDLGMVFGDGFASLAKAKLPTAALTRIAIHGDRLPAPEAQRLGAIDAALPLDDVVTAAVTKAKELASKPGATMAGLRAGLFGDTIATLQAS